MSQKLRSEQSSKRPRLSAYERSTQQFRDFLSVFDHDHPIALFISPLRRVQASVLAKNLAASGAVVFPSFEALSSQTSNVAVTVVTDDPVKARSKFSNKKAFSSVSFVSTKWASAVLSAQKLLPMDPFILAQPKPKCSTEVQLLSNSIETKALPVWCTSAVGSMSDVSVKQGYLKTLPSLSCERATFPLTLSIHHQTLRFAEFLVE